ncbi:MAG TPA: bifunctional DNA-formamidopyrimidine glycosylase/DNA-(apurinic or apyrimidinic site) lyase [Microbacteriaceae bacterium]|nr:bifunctional DNA-formamidopyrimidine glycosylase/DNA-(apurinic or apyrimidinic site) lyase [Microbacteriaceae bacterium]
MPELPEVEAMRRGLAPLAGSVIRDVEVLDPRGISRHDRSDGDFRQLLLGRLIAGSARRGKFLWLPLADDEARPEAAGATALLAHMGMSGHVMVLPPGAGRERALRVRILLDDRAGRAQALHFVDQRTFGSLAVDRLIPTADAHPAGAGAQAPLLPRQVAHIARDPLDPFFDERLFFARLTRRNSTIKRALLDQGLVSGVGNIYADETLWAARTHFNQPTLGMGLVRARRILARLREILAAAREDSGTSFDTQYVDVNGRSGRYGQHLAVYGREGRPCRRCGTPIRRVPFMNRSSHFCPRCQRIR